MVRDNRRMSVPDMCAFGYRNNVCIQSKTIQHIRQEQKS